MSTFMYCVFYSVHYHLYLCSGCQATIPSPHQPKIAFCHQLTITNLRVHVVIESGLV